MTKYLAIARKLVSSFKTCELTQIPRDQNSHADALANLASALKTTEPISIPLLVLQWPATDEDAEGLQVSNVEDGDTWMDPIISYLRDDVLPNIRTECRKIKRQASRYCLVRGKLYRRSFSGPYLKCIKPEDADLVLKELHEGECGSHSSGKSLALRVKRAGYYWPTMAQDALKMAKYCDKCQRHAQVSKLPPENLKSVSSPWPFMKWGMDIVGKFPKAPGQLEYLLVVTDYFSKWVEAEALSKITDVQIKRFLWKNVVTRFGVPQEIVTDNGPQFTSKNFKKFCEEWGIKLSFATPRHPQSNGQAESTNKTVVNLLKKRLDEAVGNWVEELPATLWACRTSIKTATGETPFALVYGSEAVSPAEVSVPTARAELLTPRENEELMALSLDLLDEKREAARVRNWKYQQEVARSYNKKVRTRTFQQGEWVLRRVFDNTRDKAAGKLAPGWEGPYQIVEVKGAGAYKLQDRYGKVQPNSWNALHLKSYFF